MLLDLATLTVMLYFSGGTGNPFSFLLRKPCSRWGHDPATSSMESHCGGNLWVYVPVVSIDAS